MPTDKAVFDTRADEPMRRLIRARELLASYNQTGPEDGDLRYEILDALLGQVGPGVWIEPPFFCDYGGHISGGAGCFVNTNCVILDGAPVTIVAGTLLGPGVQIYATSHPVHPDERVYDRDGVPAYHSTAEPVTIGDKVWIGGGAIILPGISIGAGSAIGAGAVVTQDVPDLVFAAGNPARVIRKL